ncbi:hypothetical protein SDC9_164200 [bioreactor metagenome]|uniref:Uncharacterized protein n=1 Tax=bioreactor metagenome TaxID=1076179 RepID=A0A645FY71_9ZZZZ
MPGQRYFLPHRRRQHDRAELLRMTPDGIFLVLLEHRVELERTGLPFTGQADDQPAFLGLLQVFGGDQVAQQHLVVARRYPVEIA